MTPEATQPVAEPELEPALPLPFRPELLPLHSIAPLDWSADCVDQRGEETRTTALSGPHPFSTSASALPSAHTWSVLEAETFLQAAFVMGEQG